MTMQLVYTSVTPRQQTREGGVGSHEKAHELSELFKYKAHIKCNFCMTIGYNSHTVLHKNYYSPAEADS